MSEYIQVGERIDNIIDAFKAEKPANQPFESRTLIAPQTTYSQSDWINCNLCDAKICIKYLDNHVLQHVKGTLAITPPSRREETSFKQESSSRAITIHSQSNSSSSSSYTALNKPKISHTDPFRFRNIEHTSVQATTSKTGRFSDITVVFWDSEKPYVHSSVYSGYGASYVSRDWERIAIHLFYDSVEDYYILSAKILRRASYSSYDSEEGIPDRVLEQHQLRAELKRACIFLRVNPAAAWRAFRKATRSFDIESKDGVARIAKTKNMKDLEERLNKVSSYSSGPRYGEYE